MSSQRTSLTDIKSSGKAMQELVSLYTIYPWRAEVKLDTHATAVASKSGAMAAKSTRRVKEEEGGSKASKKIKRTERRGSSGPRFRSREQCSHPGAKRHDL